MRIYLASSWRNERHPEILAVLRGDGHQVYDYRRPSPEDRGFSWEETWPTFPDDWAPASFRDVLAHASAVAAYERNSEALYSCDALVLLLPCGRSAHMEAGFAKGLSKRLYILADADPAFPELPKLMYGFADRLCLDVEELRSQLAGDDYTQTYAYSVPRSEPVCRVCGCWNEHACPEGCEWVEHDLCSACAPKEATV